MWYPIYNIEFYDIDNKPLFTATIGRNTDGTLYQCVIYVPESRRTAKQIITSELGEPVFKFLDKVINYEPLR